MFNVELCATRINGIYETQVPPMFKALVQIGSICQLKSVKNANSNNIFLKQLHRVDFLNNKCLVKCGTKLAFFYQILQIKLINFKKTEVFFFVKEFFLLFV